MADDIDLKALLKHVETAKKEWESTVDSIDDMVLLVDTNDRIQRCNKSFLNFSGKQYSQILGLNFKDFLKECGIDIDINVHGGSEIETFHQPSARYFIVDFHPYKLSGSDKMAGAAITIKDITEFKNLTDALEVTNSEISREKNELEFALNEMDFLLREVENHKDITIRFARQDGIESEFVYRISSHFNSMMDMLESEHVELQKAYAELKTAQSQILQQEKMASIGQLAAGVAHEINNPMGFISSNLSTLGKYIDRLKEFIAAQSTAIETSAQQAVKEELNEKKKRLKIDYVIEDSCQLLSESLEGAERVKKIVQNLKAFSRVDEAERKAADINAGIESTLNIVWNELKYKATVKKEYGDIPSAVCSLGQLNQVFMNILVNAAHAIEKQGEIIIKTWHENNNIFISISDTGSGIPSDKLNRIFEPFYTTKEVGKGTGLGLSIAYDIVKKHNGDITVESEVGKGTTFTVKIPVK